MTEDQDDEDFMFTKQSDPNEDEEEEMLFLVGAWIAIAWLAWMAWLS